MRLPEHRSEGISEEHPVKRDIGSTADLEVQQSRRVSLRAVLAEGLPTLPAYVFELNNLLSSSPVDLKRIGEVIRTDPSLTAQVLRQCNSPLLGIRGHVSSIEHAVVLLGTERLRTLVLTCSLLECVGHRISAADVASFWQHSFLTASLAERLARGTAYPQPEQAYLSGLLHDIGALPLLVVSYSTKPPRTTTPTLGWGESVELEWEHFGVDHCGIGHYIGVSWNFAPPLLEVLQCHHQSQDARLDPRLVGIVAAADQFCVRRGVVLGAGPPKDLVTTPEQYDALLRDCLPGLAAENRRRLAEMLEADFLYLVRMLEAGTSGILGSRFRAPG